MNNEEVEKLVTPTRQIEITPKNKEGKKSNKVKSINSRLQDYNLSS